MFVDFRRFPAVIVDLIALITVVFIWWKKMVQRIYVWSFGVFAQELIWAELLHVLILPYIGKTVTSQRAHSIISLFKV